MHMFPAYYTSLRDRTTIIQKDVSKHILLGSTAVIHGWVIRINEYKNNFNLRRENDICWLL